MFTVPVLGLSTPLSMSAMPMARSSTPSASIIAGRSSFALSLSAVPMPGLSAPSIFTIPVPRLFTPPTSAVLVSRLFAPSPSMSAVSVAVSGLSPLPFPSSAC